MIIIAHRGCIDGPNKKENHPDFIKAALKQGFHVEVDVWLVNTRYILGHDAPQYEVDRSFLSHKFVWCHAKTLETLHSLMSKGNFIHSFYHDQDEVTITSQGWVWTYPGKMANYSRSIAVLPEQAPGMSFMGAGGICTDFATQYKLGKR